MKKSSRPIRTNRPSSSKSSMNRSSGAGAGGSRSSGSMNQPRRPAPRSVSTPRPSGMNAQPDRTPDAFDQSKKGMGGGQYIGGNQTGNMNQPYGQTYAPQPRRRLGTPLIILIVVIACCLLALCVLGIYLVTQGVIDFSSF